jgi:hypothetical protein
MKYAWTNQVSRRNLVCKLVYVISLNKYYLTYFRRGVIWYLIDCYDFIFDYGDGSYENQLISE